jgi:hypothetical protein
MRRNVYIAEEKIAKAKSHALPLRRFPQKREDSKRLFARQFQEERHGLRMKTFEKAFAPTSDRAGR